MKRIIFTLLILSARVCNSCPKNRSILEQQGCLPRPKPPTDTPKIFAPGLLAEPGAWAGDRVAFSADGKEFYYSHNTTWFSNQNAKFKTIKYQNGHWGKPTVVSLKYYAPTFSADEKTMYLIGGPQPRNFGPAVWQSHRTDIGWTTPRFTCVNLMRCTILCQP